MRIIGHRGAAGSELENTLASLQAGLSLGVYAIEFDVRKTRDGQLVVCHDADLSRISEDKRKISSLTLKQLQKIPLLTGATVPTLTEALEVVGTRRCVIEVKDAGCSKQLLDVLSQFPKAKVSIASFKLEELAAIRALADKQYPLYALERTRPFDVIHFARQLKLDGVGLNYWLLNPLTYWRCKRAKLELYVYTVNSPFLAKFLHVLYPDAQICTDYPERFRQTKARQ